MDSTHRLGMEVPVDETTYFCRSKYDLVDQHKRPQARSIAFDIVWKARNFRIRYSCELIGLAEVNTFLLMHGKGTRQVRHKHCKKVLAKGLQGNPCIMAEVRDGAAASPPLTSIDCRYGFGKCTPFRKIGGCYEDEWRRHGGGEGEATTLRYVWQASLDSMPGVEQPKRRCRCLPM
eukprot:scaffold810_cov355-Pavlova_lutheri.AAC.5